MNQIIRSALPHVLVGPEDPGLIRDELLSEIFAATAQAAPARVALVCGDQRLSYAELDRRANAVARRLRARGLGRGCFVGLWMARGLDLHVALLGILKSGAAYVPFDFDVPAERVASCLEDAGARAIVVDAATRAKAGALTVAMLDTEQLTEDGPAPDLRADGAVNTDPAYLIYTSGSTGKPKAVVVSHANICHYLRAANTVYGLVPEDVVFQGASVAFDLSLEEIFVPYLVGATLWVATRETLQAADKLADVLEGAGITVLDTVPTLLSLMPRDVASLRVIILGGEACPPAVAARWCRAGRKLFNSYGPTEATVVATVAEVHPDKPVTIGRPIPNYTCYVVDDALNPVAPGGTGELLIGGPGVAGGYLGRPELTAQKFIVNPFRANGPDPILYRSGDAVSVDEDGNLAFHGRIDDQVKIRGFRVELGEIEARLADLPAVAGAAVALRSESGTDRLVAFVVAKPGEAFDAKAARDALKAQMACYMVPSHYELVAELPRLVSGKTDRKALATLPLTEVAREEQEQPQTATEAALLDAALSVFPGQTIAFDADFFLDLGGHSLIAAKFVSAVRATPALNSLTLQDVYGLRSLRAMAEVLDGRASANPPRDLGFSPPPLMRRMLCGLAQAAVLPLILALTTAPWLGVFVSYMLLSGEDAGMFGEMGTLMATYAVINLGSMVVAIAGKWLVLGRTKPGRYKLWGAYYFRWWLAQRFISLVHVKWLQCSPLIRWYLTALGAKVGKDAVLCELEAGAIDLVTIGDYTAIGGKVRLANAEVIGDELVIGPIAIGKDVCIGTSCVIGHDVTIGDSAELADLTSLPPGTDVGAGELWDGSPGAKAGMVDQSALPAQSQAGAATRLLHNLVYVFALIALPPITLMPILPAFSFFDRVAEFLGSLAKVDDVTLLPVVAWPTAMVLIVVTVLLIVAVRWLVLPKVRPGTYSVHSFFYLRKWIVALTTELTLETLSSLYATVYMRMWYRLMGAKIGKDAEISTNLAGRYDLTEIGEKCFIADEVVLGDETIRRGHMMLEPVRTGAQVFVGNDAVVPPGSDLPGGTLIGIKSKPPANSQIASGDTWFGSPPIKLPTRQRFDDMQANWTYTPPRWRRLARAVFEAFSVSLPTMLFITMGTQAVDWLTPAIVARDYATVLPQFAVASVAISVAMVLVAVAVKWLVMGTYRPTVKPMWSWWALRTEAVAVMYWGMAGKVLLDHLRGTPMLPWMLRLFGCKFGRGVFMDTTDITEFDCVKVGDFCAINSLSALQTHLYEDRVMKVGRVELAEGVTLGSGSTVLYDTQIGQFAQIGQLTIVMKGEAIPAHTAWHGAPAVTIQTATVAAKPAEMPEAVGLSTAAA